MTQILTPTSFAGLTIEKPSVTVPTLTMLVYGRSGIGKTTLAGSADTVPEMRKVLYLDVEAGTLSLRKTNYEVDVMRITDYRQFAEVYAALYAGNHGYQTVVLDSLTEIQDLCMREIMREMKEDPENSERDSDVPGMYEWNKNEKRIKRLIRLFRDLPLNVIFTSLVREDKDTKTGVVMKLPDLPGKLASRVAALFDIVLYFTAVGEEGTQKRIVASQSGTNTVAKNRGSDRLPPILEIPDTRVASAMSIIYPMIVGEVGQDAGVQESDSVGVETVAAVAAS